MKINYDIIIDKTEGQFTDILRFAWHNPLRDSLKKNMMHLEQMVLNRGDNIVVELYPDKREFSVKFAFINTLKNNIGTCGELVYIHKIGWQIQTLN